MSDSYRGRSRRSETSSGSSSSGGSQHGSPGYYPQATSHSSGHSNLSYPPVTSGQYSYYPGTPSPGQQGPPSSHSSYYATGSPPEFEGSPPPASGYGHHHTSSSGHAYSASGVPRHSTYPGPAPSASSERASKRQRASTTDQGQHMQTQWTDAPAQEYSHSAARRGERGYAASRGSRQQSSGSSGYNSPGYSHGNYHDPYGQQLLQPPSTVPSVGPSTMRDPHLYGMRHSHHPSSDDEAEHGPTELPPRTYSGKSQYDPPKKPGKIPGSAMDYLPILEARFDRLETAVDRYVEYRGQRALSNSILPGMDETEDSSNREASSSSSRHPRGSSRR